MISILLVEDDIEKARLISSVILEVPGVDESCITHVSALVDAKRQLKNKTFDLLILDINLPKRLDLPVSPGSGLEIMASIKSPTPKLNIPHYIVGLTADKNALAESGDAFSGPLWKLIHFQHDDATWKQPMREAVAFLVASHQPPYRNDGSTYHTTLGIVVGLETVELDSVLRAAQSFTTFEVPHDPCAYYRGEFSDDRGRVDFVLASAPKMGLANISVVTTRLIDTFRPQYLAITGICAGVREKTSLGDLLVADPCWDWGSGKIATKDAAEVFLNAPYQWRLDATLRSIAQSIGKDSDWLETAYSNWSGGRPDHKPRLYIDAMASGASVLQRRVAMEAILKQHKNLIGVDMEIFGALTAASYAPSPRPTAIGVKSVCDFGEEDKGDAIQAYAAYMSASFIRELALRRMASEF